jgi:hypothetical protein
MNITELAESLISSAGQHTILRARQVQLSQACDDRYG